MENSSIIKLILFAIFFTSALSFAQAPLPQGKNVRGKSEVFTEKSVLLYFWATWCPDCKSSLKKKLPKLQSQQLRVVSINTDATIEKVIDYLEHEEVDISTYVDLNKNLRKFYGVFSVPTAILLQREGNEYRVEAKYIGSELENIHKNAPKGIL